MFDDFLQFSWQSMKPTFVSVAVFKKFEIKTWNSTWRKKYLDEVEVFSTSMIQTYGFFVSRMLKPLGPPYTYVIPIWTSTYDEGKPFTITQPTAKSGPILHLLVEVNKMENGFIVSENAVRSPSSYSRMNEGTRWMGIKSMEDDIWCMK